MLIAEHFWEFIEVNENTPVLTVHFPDLLKINMQEIKHLLSFLKGYATKDFHKALARSSKKTNLNRKNYKTYLKQRKVQWLGTV